MNKDPLIKKYGIIIGLVAALIMLIGILMPEYQYIAGVNYVAIPAGIIFCCFEYSRDRDGDVTFGQLFQAGFQTGLIVTVILILATILFNLLFPDIKELGLNTLEEAYSQQDIPTDTTDTIINLMDKYWLVMSIASTIFLGLIGSVVSALLGAAIARKNPQQ